MPVPLPTVHNVTAETRQQHNSAAQLTNLWAIGQRQYCSNVPETKTAFSVFCQSENTRPNSQLASQLTSDLLSQSYLRNLDTPVEQQLGPNVVLVLVDVVEQAPVRHQLRDQLDGGTQADTQQADQVGVLHASHDEGLLLRPKNI